MNLFREVCAAPNDKHNRCDVCRNQQVNSVIEIDRTHELKILYDVIDVLGSRGEVKISPWIRSSLAWTDSFNKNLSYGSSMGHSEMWWCIFMRKCHVLGCAHRKLVSLIEESKHSTIQGIICKTAKREDIMKSSKHFYVMQLVSDS